MLFSVCCLQFFLYSHLPNVFSSDHVEPLSSFCILFLALVFLWPVICPIIYANLQFFFETTYLGSKEFVFFRAFLPLSAGVVYVSVLCVLLCILLKHMYLCLNSAICLEFKHIVVHHKSFAYICCLALYVSVSVFVIRCYSPSVVFVYGQPYSIYAFVAA